MKIKANAQINGYSGVSFFYSVQGRILDRHMIFLANCRLQINVTKKASRRSSGLERRVTTPRFKYQNRIFSVALHVSPTVPYQLDQSKCLIFGDDVQIALKRCASSAVPEIGKRPENVPRVFDVENKKKKETSQ